MFKMMSTPTTIMVLLIVCGSTLGKGGFGVDPFDAPYGPMEKLFNQGRNPVVAATYYFNSHAPNKNHHDYDQPRSASGSSPPMVSASPSGSNFEIDQDRNSQSDDFFNSCFAPDGRRGSCYEAKECISRGGTPMGSCSGHQSLNQPSSSSGSGSPSSSGSSSAGMEGSVCCLFEVTCGDSSYERTVYFRNPGFPHPFRGSRMCRVRVGKRDPSVCQMRVDMTHFDLSPPIQGNCSKDLFVVSGQNENNVIPKICGKNHGQHYYFGVDESGIISLNMMLMGSYDRRFDLMITQIGCDSERKAPPHCLQYHQGPHGRIKSFNYDASHPNHPVVDGYPNDLDYIICIRKESGFCSISYELATSDSYVAPFSVGSLPKDVAAARSLGENVVSSCVDDYLVIGGMRMCSASLSGADVMGDSIDSSSTKSDLTPGSIVNASFHSPLLVTDNTPGPFLMRFVSSAAENAKGFNILFKQNPCK